jgi:PAS domain S-box-containing protein
VTEEAPSIVLLVDDQPQNLNALKAILRNQPYRLLSTTSGEEALQLAVRERLAVILLDVVMPGMDGFEVARHLKALEYTRHIPILFLTAVATEIEHIYRAYNAGAVDYLIKPLDPEVVRKKVAVFVDLVQQREKIERQAQLLRETERREHELRLGELRMATDRHYRKLIEGISRAIGWSAEGASLRLTFVNRQAQRILGYRGEQFLEPNFWEEHLHPQDRDTVLALFRRAVAEGADLTCNHRMITADGGVVWFHTCVSGGKLQPNEPSALDGVSVDITELKRAEEKQALFADVFGILSASLDYRETLPRVAARAVPQVADWCVIDEVKASDRVQQIAEAHVDPTQQTWLRMLERRPTLDSMPSAGIAKVLRTAQPELHREIPSLDWLADAMGAVPSDLLRTLGAVSCMFVPVAARGRVLAVITFVSSESQWKLGPADVVLAQELCRKIATAMESSRLYEEAQRATEAREALLAVVSHDLRSPLNAIKIGAHLLAASAPPEQVQRTARSVLRSSERMERLIGDLLDYARLQGGQLPIERQRVDVAGLVHESVEQFEPLASEKRIRLEGRPGEEAIYCDRNRVLQILSNLVGNALKFTPENGSVVISSERVDGEVRFAVSDTGPGIPEEQLPHIWERFWQADKTTGVGVGLGLSISEGLVRAHGGRIWVESQVGRGTTFYFTLPLAKEIGLAEEGPGAPRAG